MLPASGCAANLIAALDSDASKSSFVATKGRTIGCTMSLARLVRSWRAAWAIQQSDAVVWPLAHPLACAIARGLWYGDVSVRFRRAGPLEHTSGPTSPSDGLMRFFIGQDVCDGYPLPPQQASVASKDSDVEVFLAPKGFVVRYTPEHILSCLEVGVEVKDVKRLRAILVSSLKFWYPRSWRRRIASKELKGRRVMDRSTLHRAVVKVDIAAMLARRAWRRENSPTYRYLAFDASPQRGQEFVVTVERVIVRSTMASHVSSDAWSARPVVETRIMPLATLGKNRMGLAEKLQAHIHQTWLEYGPAVSDVRAANSDVRVCLSDMGTEFGIGDAKDVVATCLTDVCDQSQQGQQ